MSDLVGQIIAYESGEMSNAEMLDMFSELIKSGTVWTLQGSYGRTANALIESAILTPAGEITQYGHDLLEEEAR